jgi:hypothetical protein
LAALLAQINEALYPPTIVQRRNPSDVDGERDRMETLIDAGD